MKSQVYSKGVSDYVALFCQRTSIRGIPKIENSKFNSIKVFWAFFILCAHSIMIALSVLLIQRYFRFDTTMQSSTSKVNYMDFPEITICSKRFFEMDPNDTISAFGNLDSYSLAIYNNISNLILNENINSALKVLQTKFTTSAFFHDYFNFIKSRSITLAKNLKDKCVVFALNGRFDRNKKLPCKVRPVLNPIYLNCLAFSMPKNNFMNLSTKFQMDININFATSPKQSIIGSFKMDEYMTDTTNDDGYQETKIYINKYQDYPFDFDFEAPFDCKGSNHYLVEKSRTLFYYSSTTPPKCRITNLTTSSYGITFLITRETLCTSLVIQRQVLLKCQCSIDSYPSNDTSYSMIGLCSDSDTATACADEVIYNQNVSDSTCVQHCNLTDFNVIYKLKPFYSSDFSAKMDSLLYQVSGCEISCSNIANCILQMLFVNNNNIQCNPTLLSRKKRQGSSYLSNSIQTNTAPTVTTTPTTSTTSATSSNTNSNCTKISIRVQMRPKLKIQTESLVVEVNTLLSQLGGIFSFFTGLTFTIIAEILETFIFFFIDKTSEKKE